MPKPQEPPRDLAAEQALLGTLMLNKDAACEIFAEVTSDMFSLPSHRIVYQAANELYAANIKIDQISLADKLKSNHELDKIGGPVAVLDIAQGGCSSYDWRNCINIVQRHATARGLIEAGLKITAIGNDMPQSVAEGIGQAEETLFEVTQQQVSTDFVSIADLAQPAYERLARGIASEREQGVQSGFDRLDDLLVTMRGGDLVIVAARPAVGKTAFALNVATNAAKQGAHVAFFSLEMSDSQLAERILCAEGEVNRKEISRSNFETSKACKALLEAGSKLSQLKIDIDDSSALTMRELSAKAKRHLRNAKGKGLVIVDYLQLIQPASTRDSHQVEIAEISRALKILAKELDMPVIALSQLSRAVEQRKGKRPQLSDLRESGAIEQDADIVILLDRSTTPEEAQLEDRPNEGEALAIVAKHRNGETGTAKLMYIPEYTKFKPIEPNFGMYTSYATTADETSVW